MLMLVVTIIIAAIVSAFAGSSVQTNDKAPQAAIQGTLYVNGSTGQSGGPTNLVKLNHMGGDDLSTPKIQIIIKRGDSFGPYVGTLQTTVVDKSNVHNTVGKYWFNATDGGMDVIAWRSGEIMYYDGGGMSSDDVGKSLVLEVTTTDGRLISTSKMMVVA